MRDEDLGVQPENSILETNNKHAQSLLEEKPKATMFAFGKIEQKSSFLEGLLNQKKN